MRLDNLDNFLATVFLWKTLWLIPLINLGCISLKTSWAEDFSPARMASSTFRTYPLTEFFLPNLTDVLRTVCRTRFLAEALLAILNQSLSSIRNGWIYIREGAVRQGLGAILIMYSFQKALGRDFKKYSYDTFSISFIFDLYLEHFSIFMILRFWLSVPTKLW